MKRPAIAALLLLLLALLAWLARLGSREAAPSAPPPELERAAGASESPAATIGSEDAIPSAAARLPAARPTIGPEPSGESTESERAPAAPIELATVRLLVRDARTQEPVHAGSVRLGYELPEHAASWRPESPRPLLGHLSSSRNTDSPGLRSGAVGGELDGRGLFDARFPIGTRIVFVAAEPPGLPDPSGIAREFFRSQQRTYDSAVPAGGLDLALDVQRGVWLEGVVRDAETHLGLGGVTLRTRGILGAAESDAHGHFELGYVQPRAGGGLTLDVTQRDHLPLVLELGSAALASGQPLEIELRRGLSVSGRLVDESGRALSDVMLALCTSGGVSASAPSASLFSSRSSAQGEFRFGPIAPCRAATITIVPQEHGGAPVLGLERPLGALQRDIAGLELRLATAGSIAVRVELASGSVLAPRDVHLFANGVPDLVPGRVAPDGESQLLQVPLGVEFELVALARASAESKETHFLHGSQRVHLDRRAAEPPLVRIVLGASASFDLPPPPEGAQELALGAPGPLLGAFDVQLLDAGSGQALEEGRRVSLSAGGASLSTTKLVHGWLRIRARPGRQRFEVELEGGPRTSVECTIPLGGYARGEWRLEGGP